MHLTRALPVGPILRGGEEGATTAMAPRVGRHRNQADPTDGEVAIRPGHGADGTGSIREPEDHARVVETDGEQLVGREPFAGKGFVDESEQIADLRPTQLSDALHGREVSQ